MLLDNWLAVTVTVPDEQRPALAFAVRHLPLPRLTPLTRDAITVTCALAVRLGPGVVRQPARARAGIRTTTGRVANLSREAYLAADEAEVLELLAATEPDLDWWLLLEEAAERVAALRKEP